MKDLIFLKPTFEKQAWGTDRFSDYGYPNNEDLIGKMICVNEDSIIADGEFQGLKLKDVFTDNKDLFGEIELDKFPFEVSLKDASDDLPLVVNPGEDRKLIHILESNKGKMVLAHTAQNQSEFIEKIRNGLWNKILNVKKVKKEQSYFVNSGVLHGIGKDNFVYEIKSGSNTEHTVYDYNRMYDGKPLKLELKEALEVLKYPGVVGRVKEEPLNDFTIRLINAESFVVEKITNFVNTNYFFDYSFLVLTVTKGTGKFNDIDIKLGDTFIVPSGITEFSLDGEITVLVAHV